MWDSQCFKRRPRQARLEQSQVALRKSQYAETLKQREINELQQRLHLQDAQLQAYQDEVMQNDIDDEQDLIAMSQLVCDFVTLFLVSLLLTGLILNSKTNSHSPKRIIDNCNRRSRNLKLRW